MKLWSTNSVQKNGGGFNPERRLLAAILQRAITDYLSAEGEIHESAKEWLFNDEDLVESRGQEAFGFSFICEALDLEMDELRKAIKRQLDERPVAAVSSEENYMFG